MAPVARIPLGEAFILKVRSMPERTTFNVQVQVRASSTRIAPRWKSFDTAQSDRRGRMNLPALDARKPGEYLIRLRGPGGDNYFLRIVVGRASGG